VTKKNVKLTHEEHKKVLIENFSQMLLDKAYSDEELTVLFKQGLDGYDERCEYCCYRYERDKEAHDHAMDVCESRAEKLDAQYDVLSGYGCFTGVICLLLLILMIIIVASDEERPKWVDRDVNLIRHRDKLYRAVEVKRPLVKVKEQGGNDE